MQVESYNTKRALKKIKRHPNSVDINDVSKGMEKPKRTSQSDDMEIESQSSKKDESSSRDCKTTAVIGGPSSW